MQQSKVFEDYVSRKNRSPDKSTLNVNPFTAADSELDPLVTTKPNDNDILNANENERENDASWEAPGFQRMASIQDFGPSIKILSAKLPGVGEDDDIDMESRTRLAYAMKWLSSLKATQVKRTRQFTLQNAFLKWKFEFPLALKCDELSKQCKERTSMMETVRSSYLRDVISIKIHLDRLNEVDPIDPVEAKRQLKAGMYDLHTVPSVDLRSLIEAAKNSINQTSQQLRDTLLDAGILDPITLKTLNPWEQSRGYKRILRIAKGHAYDMPDTKGESINLAAPTNKKLYVRYCSECIGITQLVKGWNEEVESSLKFKADFAKINDVIQEYRGLIEKLNGTIEHQEQNIVDLESRNHSLEMANAWFEKWSQTQGGNETPEDVFEKLTSYKHLTEMARADLESVAMNSAARISLREAEFQASEEALKQKIIALEKTISTGTKDRAKMLDDFRSCQKELGKRISDIGLLENEISMKDDHIQELDGKITKLEAEKVDLNGTIDKKEKDFWNCRETMTAKVDGLLFQLGQSREEVNHREDTIAEMKEDMRGKLILMNGYNTEIAQLKTKCVELAALIPPPKPRFTLRGVTWVVIFCVRYRMALSKSKFENLGHLGYEELLRRARVQIKELSGKLFQSQNANVSAEERLGLAEAECDTHRGRIFDALTAVSDVNIELESVKAELLRIERLLVSMSKERDELIAYKRAAESQKKSMILVNVKEALAKQHQLHVQQASVHAQTQRNVSHHLAATIFQARTIISSFAMDNNIKELSKPYEPPKLDEAVSSKSAPNSPKRGSLSLKRSFRHMRPTVIKKGRALLTWMRKNKRVSRILPKKIPVLLREMRYGEDDQRNNDGDNVEREEGEEREEEEEEEDEEQIQLKEMEKRRQRRQEAKAMAVMARVVERDFHTVDEIRSNALKDVRRIQDYLLAYKTKHYELLGIISAQQQELAALKGASKKRKVSSIKKSFHHLMGQHSDRKGNYFQQVLKAIEQVQAEQGELHRDKLAASGKLRLAEVMDKLSLQSDGLEDTPVGASDSGSMELGDLDKSVRSGSILSSSKKHQTSSPNAGASVKFSFDADDGVAVGAGTGAITQSTPSGPPLANSAKISKFLDGEGNALVSASSKLHSLHEHEEEEEDTLGFSGKDSHSSTPAVPTNTGKHALTKAFTSGSYFFKSVPDGSNDEEESENGSEHNSLLNSQPSSQPNSLPISRSSSPASALAERAEVTEMVEAAETPSISVAGENASPREKAGENGNDIQTSSGTGTVPSPISAAPVSNADATPVQVHASPSSRVPVEREAVAVSSGGNHSGMIDATAVAPHQKVPESFPAAVTNFASSTTTTTTTAVAEAHVAEEEESKAIDNALDTQAGATSAATVTTANNSSRATTASEAEGSGNSATGSADAAPTAAAAVAAAAATTTTTPTTTTPATTIAIPTSAAPTTTTTTTAPTTTAAPVAAASPSSARRSGAASAIAKARARAEARRLSLERRQGEAVAAAAAEAAAKAAAAEATVNEEAETVGFEDEEEVDADIAYIEELEAARHELMGLLGREEVIQKKLDMQLQENDELNLHLETLTTQLEHTEQEIVDLHEQFTTVQGKTGKLRNEYLQLKHENELLREIVQEDYRYHANNLDKTLKQREEEETKRRSAIKMKSQHTQIACSVCAIRDEGFGEADATIGGGGGRGGGRGGGGRRQRQSHHHPASLSSQNMKGGGGGGGGDDNNDDDHESTNYDEDTVAMAHAALGEALHGGVVLVARPRNINRQLQHHLQDQLQKAVRESHHLVHKHHAKQQAAADEKAAGKESRRTSSQGSPGARKPTKRLDSTTTTEMSGQHSKQKQPRPLSAAAGKRSSTTAITATGGTERSKNDLVQQESGERFTRDEILRHIDVVQQQMLDYRKPARTQQLQTIAASHDPNNNPDTALLNENGLSSSSGGGGGGDGGTGESKFSKLKKMPKKVMLSTSSGPKYFGTNGPKDRPTSAASDSVTTAKQAAAKLSLPRPLSAQAANVRRSGTRSASHTAAYLQNQLMEDIRVLPDFDPSASDPHVPRHSVGMASVKAHKDAGIFNDPQEERRATASSQRGGSPTSAAALSTASAYPRVVPIVATPPFRPTIGRAGDSAIDKAAEAAASAMVRQGVEPRRAYSESLLQREHVNIDVPIPSTRPEAAAGAGAGTAMTDPPAGAATAARQRELARSPAFSTGSNGGDGDGDGYALFQPLITAHTTGGREWATANTGRNYNNYFRDNLAEGSIGDESHSVLVMNDSIQDN